jgi:hypothetical protein
MSFTPPPILASCCVCPTLLSSSSYNMSSGQTGRGSRIKGSILEAVDDILKLQLHVLVGPIVGIVALTIPEYLQERRVQHGVVEVVLGKYWLRR